MFYLLNGASGAGKSEMAKRLKEQYTLKVTELDQLGSPDNPTNYWRQKTAELMVNRAIEYQRQEVDYLLVADTNLSEILVLPQATKLKGITACLLDCSDPIRVSRLTEDSKPVNQETLNRASFMRMQAYDPFWELKILQSESYPKLRWSRLEVFKDREYQHLVLNTDDLSLEQTYQALEAWVIKEKELHERGEGGFSGLWWKKAII